MTSPPGEAAWMSSGLASLTGRADGPALVPRHRTALAARAWGELLSSLTGGRVDLDGAALLTERAAMTGRGRAGATSAGGSCRLLAAADGWVALSCARPGDDDLAGALVGRTPSGSPWPDLARWCRGRTAGEIVGRARLLGLAAAAVGEWRRPAPARRPIGLPIVARGALVVDFSALWAGPLCAHLLGLAGADVVKVETPQRPDGARFGHGGFYDLLHAGHRSVVLDPDDPVDRRALHALAARADVVIEASRPRALARWGLDARRAAAAGTVWLSITAYGRAHDRVGFGDDVAAAAGLVAWEADSGAPVFCGDAIADPLTGLYAACRVLERLGRGEGALLDVAMAAVAAATVASPWRTPARPVDAAPPPAARSVAAGPAGAAAPESGLDTEAVLAELGIR
ncbi:CoA transferase [Nonomuraea bangladeshensis]|uniref:CoA transferase n=1 Tax=Nonomuraea bangladeshensis TaxID=404385 RepID=UPI003C2C2DCB